MIWMFIFLGLSAAVGAGTWIYLRRVEGGQTQAGKKPVKEKRKKGEIAEAWEIEKIERGVVKLPGNRFRLICRVTAPDYYLLGVEGQDAVEDAAAAALRQLSDPVQAVITATVADTASEVELLRSRVPQLSLRLAELAVQRAEYLEARSRDRADTVRQAYLVLSWDAGKDVSMAQAWGEMMARAASLAGALEGARIRLEPLDSAGAIDLLGHFLRRGSPLRPSEAVERGALELYSISAKEAV